MFGKTKEAPQTQSDRYSVEVFHSAGKHETLAAGLEEAMNTGEDAGWTLAFITQHGGTFFIFWDKS